MALTFHDFLLCLILFICFACVDCYLSHPHPVPVNRITSNKKKNNSSDLSSRNNPQLQKINTSSRKKNSKLSSAPPKRFPKMPLISHTPFLFIFHNRILGYPGILLSIYALYHPMCLFRFCLFPDLNKSGYLWYNIVE